MLLRLWEGQGSAVVVYVSPLAKLLCHICHKNAKRSGTVCCAGCKGKVSRWQLPAHGWARAARACWQAGAACGRAKMGFGKGNVLLLRVGKKPAPCDCAPVIGVQYRSAAQSLPFSAMRSVMAVSGAARPLTNGSPAYMSQRHVK